MISEFVSCFRSGFLMAGRFLAYLLGLGAPILLILCVLALAGLFFDRATATIAKRWVAKGVQPKGRAAGVILAHYQRHGKV